MGAKYGMISMFHKERPGYSLDEWILGRRSTEVLCRLIGISTEHVMHGVLVENTQAMRHLQECLPIPVNPTMYEYWLTCFEEEPVYAWAHQALGLFHW